MIVDVGQGLLAFSRLSHSAATSEVSTSPILQTLKGVNRQSGSKIKLTNCCGLSETSLITLPDYVTRRFERIFGRGEGLGLDLR